MRAGADARDLTTTELRECMTWVGRQDLRYDAFVSSVVLTSSAVMEGAAGRHWEFPTSERWALVAGKLRGALRALQALLRCMMYVYSTR